MSEPSTQLIRGTLHLLILRQLDGPPRHGYAIAEAIARRSSGELDLEDGALYQSLHRLEERGFVESTWGHADNGKRAKFYRMTTSGRRQLQLETASWVRYAEAVFKVLQPV